jgi:ATP-dependent DNA ligase
MVLIAEAYIPDNTFQVTNGIFNRSVGEYRCKDVVFICHDLIVPNSTANTALERYTLLQQFFDATWDTVKRTFKVAPVLLASPFHEKLWYETFDKVANAGGEGIVAKREDSVFSFGKRNSDLLKLKLETTVDVLAVRLEEGFGDKGNPSLTLVSRRSNGAEIRTVIGKHSDQALFRAKPAEVIGKVIEVKAMEEYQDGQLRQPVFVRVREDKSSNNIN